MESSKGIIKDVLNHKYEVSDEGIYLPRHQLKLGGVFHTEHVRNGVVISESDDHNLTVTQGLTHILDVALRGAAQVTTWYVGLFKGNYTPVAGDTMLTFPGSATEATEYSEGTRVAYNEAFITSTSVSNSASRATFNANNTVSIYGAFLSSSSTKADTAGTLLAAAKFAAVKNLVNTDQLLVTYTFSIADV